MLDNEFEKQVHKKMGELKLEPSEAVWERVEMRLQRKEKRRRWVLWVPFLLVIAVAGGYLAFNPSTDRTLQQPVSRNEINIENSKQLKGSGGSPVIDDTAQINSTRLPAETTNLYLRPNQTQKNLPANDLVGRTKPNKSDDNMEESRGKPLRVTDLFPKDAGDTAAASALPKRGKLSGDKARAGSRLLQSNQRDDLQQRPVAVIEGLPVTPGEPVVAEEEVILPARVGPYPRTAGSINTSSITVNENATSIKRSRRASAWKMGLTFQGGRTSLTTGSFNKLFSSSPYRDANVGQSANPNSPGNQGNPPGNAVFAQPYPMKASAGFSVGAFMKRQLSPRLSISLGLNYALYKTSNRVGTRVDSSGQFGFSGNQNLYSQYYRVGSTVSYTNSYHYLELPVNIQTKLTRRWRLPVYWDLGVSVSRLLATNALHYDDNTRVYFKDDNLFRKTQLNFHTGIPLQLVSAKRFGLQAGPQVQYGLNSLLKDKSAGGKHFFFAGLKANLEFGKNW